MKLSTETTSPNLSGWNWTQLASFRAANDVVSPYVQSLIIVRPIRRREPCFFTVKFHRSRRLLAVTLNRTIIFITLILGISLSTYIKTVYWSWVTIRFSVFRKIYSWFTNHSPQNKKFTDLSRKSRKLSGPEKPFQKLRSAYSRKLAFSYDFKIRKGKTCCKISLLRTSSSLRYVGNYSTRNRPRKFRKFRKTGPRWGYQFTHHNWNWTLYTNHELFPPQIRRPCTTLFKVTFALAGNLRNSSLDLALASWRRSRQIAAVWVGILLRLKIICYIDISSTDDRHVADSRPLGSDRYVDRVITASIDRHSIECLRKVGFYSPTIVRLSTDMSTECRSTGRSSVNHTHRYFDRVSIADIDWHTTAGAFSTHDPPCLH